MNSDDPPTEQVAMQTPASTTTSSSVWDKTPVEPQQNMMPAQVTKSASIATPGWGPPMGAPERSSGGTDWGDGGWNPGNVTKTVSNWRHRRS